MNIGNQIEPVEIYGCKVFMDGMIIGASGKVLSPVNDTWGCPMVGVKINNHWTKKRVHRLVVECYLPNPLSLDTINHKDGNKTNNSVDNLEWMSYRDNLIHAINTGLRSSSHARTVDRSSLKGMGDEKAALIIEELKNSCERYSSGKLKRGEIQRLSDKYGVKGHCIRNIIKGKSYANLPR